MTSTSTTNETKIHRDPPQVVVAGFVAAAAGVPDVLTVAVGVAAAAAGVLTVSAGVAAAAGVADSL